MTGGMRRPRRSQPISVTGSSRIAAINQRVDPCALLLVSPYSEEELRRRGVTFLGMRSALRQTPYPDPPPQGGEKDA